MKTANAASLACRHCRFYLPEGRRGGNCERLSAPVQSNWKACTLALPPFAPSWENIDNIMVWPQHTIQLEATLQKGPCERRAEPPKRTIPAELEPVPSVLV